MHERKAYPGLVISVVIPTYNRPQTLVRALESVLAQARTDFEVIVIDDGSDPPVVLPGAIAARVRLLRTEHAGPGAARAYGLNAARGVWVAYCDDDDEWYPDHLSHLYRYLTAHPDVSLVYGDSEWVQEGIPHTIPFSIDYDRFLLADANYIFASDVMHRADVARAVGGFDMSLAAYEDWDLWLRLGEKYTLRHLPVVVGSHRWHPGCVGASEHWPAWQHVYDQHQQRQETASLAAQHGLRVEAARASSFEPRTWCPSGRQLIWHSLLRPNQGYGSVARQLLCALEQQDINIHMAPTVDQVPADLAHLYKPLDHWGRLGFYYDYRHRPSALPCERIINYSMAESTGFSDDDVREINSSVTLQYVPCQGNVDIFRDRGVRVPIKILHHGVDAARFPFITRGDPDVFTFGTFGELSPRKGIDVLIRAFQDEFASHESVRLVMKSVSPAAMYSVTDPRITVVAGFADHATLLDLLRQMNAFVLPSRGEGFGLCGLEAMSTGLPLIATNWSGPAEYLDPADGYPLSYRLVDAGGIEAHHRRFYGLWAEPSYEHLRSLLRFVYEHPDEAKQKGKLAAQRTHAEWTWDRIARQIRDDLDVLVGI